MGRVREGEIDLQKLEALTLWYPVLNNAENAQDLAREIVRRFEFKTAGAAQHEARDIISRLDSQNIGGYLSLLEILENAIGWVRIKIQLQNHPEGS